MPRNIHEPERRSRHRSGSKKRKHAPFTEPNWDRAKELHFGQQAEPREQTVRRKAESRPPVNEFVRQLRGFAGRAIDLLSSNRVDMVRHDQDGELYVPIAFTGRSVAPVKEIPLSKLSAVGSRNRLLVISGVVGVPDRREVGQGPSEVKPTVVPVLDSHNAPGRFNMAIGHEPTGITPDDLTAALGNSSLFLSGITEVNGHAIQPGASSGFISLFWNTH